jgi:hypothetical protein
VLDACNPYPPDPETFRNAIQDEGVALATARLLTGAAGITYDIDYRRSHAATTMRLVRSWRRPSCEGLRLLREAREWLTDVAGAGLVAAHRGAIEADLPQRLNLVKAGFNRQDAELLRACNRLRVAAQEGRRQAADQLELVKVRHSALSKVREARLSAIRAEPDRGRAWPGSLHRPRADRSVARRGRCEAF